MSGPERSGLLRTPLRHLLMTDSPVEEAGFEPSVPLYTKWTGTGVPRNAGFLPMILPINRSLVGARVERFSSARRRRGARFEKQSKKIKWCKVDGHVVDPIGTNRTLGPL